MTIDSKKLQSLLLTYATLTLPIASTAFAMNASLSIKILSFFSGVLPVILRHANPKDEFTVNLVKVAQTEIDAELAKQKKSKG